MGQSVRYGTWYRLWQGHREGSQGRIGCTPESGYIHAEDGEPGHSTAAPSHGQPAGSSAAASTAACALAAAAATTTTAAAADTTKPSCCLLEYHRTDDTPACHSPWFLGAGGFETSSIGFLVAQIYCRCVQDLGMRNLLIESHVFLPQRVSTFVQ